MTTPATSRTRAVDSLPCAVFEPSRHRRANLPDAHGLAHERLDRDRARRGLRRVESLGGSCASIRNFTPRRVGWATQSARISSVVMPPASSSMTSATATRSPRMVGRPPQTPGTRVMRNSDMVMSPGRTAVVTLAGYHPDRRGAYASVPALGTHGAQRPASWSSRSRAPW